jgi:hypothetical protein
VKRNWLGSKKANNLVYIHNTLHLISQKYPGYESPFNKWDQYIDDATCVDKDRQPDGLVKLPPVTVPKDDHMLESDDYLESLLTEKWCTQ